MILDHLSSIAQCNNVIPDVDFELHKRHYTVHHLLRIVEYAGDDIDQNRSTEEVLVDVSKAFNKV